MAGLCAVFCNLLLLAGEAEISTERISFVISLPLENIALPAGPYLVSGMVQKNGKLLGTFYRIPRLTIPCREAPCMVSVSAEVRLKDVTEDLVRAVLLRKCRLDFNTAFHTPGDKKVSEFDIPLPISPESIGLGPGSAQNLIRIENRAVTAKNHALVVDLVLQNPFSFPLRLRSVGVKTEVVPKSVYKQTFEFDEPLPPGESTRTLSMPLKPGDLLYLVADKVLQEDYTLHVQAGIEGTLKIEIAGQTVEIPFENN